VRKAKHAPAIWVGVLLLTMTQRAAKAQDSACELVAVDAAPGLQAGWLRAADDLRAALAHEVTGPECIALRLELEPSTSGILVRVRSADGRFLPSGYS